MTEHWVQIYPPSQATQFTPILSPLPSPTIYGPPPFELRAFLRYTYFSFGWGQGRFWPPSKTFLGVRHAFLPNKRLLNYEEPLPFFGCLLLFKETNQHWLIVTNCRLVLSILYFLCETSTLHLDSCPLGARDMASEFMSGLFKSLSVRCAVPTSPPKGETAVYGYDPALFLVLSVSCDVLQS